MHCADKFAIIPAKQQKQSGQSERQASYATTDNNGLARAQG
jgi:hypothetical protein